MKGKKKKKKTLLTKLRLTYRQLKIKGGKE
jgi:hypothetical protein